MSVPQGTVKQDHAMRGRVYTVILKAMHIKKQLKNNDYHNHCHKTKWLLSSTNYPSMRQHTQSTHFVKTAQSDTDDRRTYSIQTLKRVGKARHKRCLRASSTHTQKASAVYHTQRAQSLHRVRLLEIQNVCVCTRVYTCFNCSEGLLLWEQSQ